MISAHAVRQHLVHCVQRRISQSVSATLVVFTLLKPLRKLSVKISKVTPDLLRDPPKGHGEYQCPGQVIIMPARAYGDVRFNKNKQAFRILAICCGHQNERRGNTFFINHSTIGKIVGTSRNHVTDYMNELVKWGYIEKIRKADNRRPLGQQGCVYRLILDPSISYEKQMADTTEIDDNKVQETLQKVYKPKHYERKLTEKQEKLAYVITKKYAKDNPDYSFDRIYNDVALWMTGIQTEETWTALDNKMASPYKLGYFNKPQDKPKEPVKKEVITNDEAQWKARLQNWKPGSVWSTSWGSPPNEKDHSIPLEYYNKYYKGCNDDGYTSDTRCNDDRYNQTKDVTMNVTPKPSDVTVSVTLNNNSIYNNIYNKEILINGIINSYMNVVKQTYGSDWKASENDKVVADKLLQLGYTTEQFKELATKVVNQSLQDNKQPPNTLQYFLDKKASL